MAAPSQLVLLPGLLCDADLWHGQTELLSSSIECRVADLTQGETIEALAETVLNSAAPTFALAGFSFGGYVAQEIMRMEPDRVERLALLDTSFRADLPNGRRHGAHWRRPHFSRAVLTESRAEYCPILCIRTVWTMRYWSTKSGP